MNRNRRILFFIGIVLYRFSLDIVYEYVLSREPRFGEYTNTYIGNTDDMLLSYIFLLLFCFLLTHITKNRRPSVYVLIVLFLLTYVPWNSMWGCRNIDLVYTVMINAYWMFIFLFYFVFGKRKYCLRTMNLKGVKLEAVENKYIVRIVPFVILAIIFFFSYRYFNGNINLTIDISNTYDLRMAARDYTGGEWILGRLIPWSATIVFPMAILVSVERKKYKIIPLFVIGVVICFSIVGMKQWLFILAITAGTCIYVKVFKGKNLYYVLPAGFITLNSLVLITYRIFGISSIANYTVKRVLYTPCIIAMQHIDYFINKPKLLWTQCLLGWIRKFGVVLPYNENIGHVIGRMYYSEETNATAGSIADAFENFGVIGLILNPLIIVVSLMIFDSVARELKEELYVSIIFVYAYSIMSGPLTLALLSYGFLFAMLYLWIIKKSKDLIYYNNQIYNKMEKI